MNDYKKFLLTFSGLGLALALFYSVAFAAGGAVISSVSVYQVATSSGDFVDFSSSTHNGTYKIGDQIKIAVVFSTSVIVDTSSTGAITLTLNATGTSAVTASFNATTTATTSIFLYTVAADQSTSTLDVVSLATSSGATIITDDSGDEDPASFSLSGKTLVTSSVALAIDGVRPTVTFTLSNATSISEASAGNSLVLTLTFSEAMSTATAPTIVFDSDIVDSGTLAASASWASSTEYGVTYTIADVDEEASGVTITVSGAKDALGILDTGNAMTSNVTTGGNLITVDTSAPGAISFSIPASTYGEVINVVLTSSGSSEILYSRDGTTPTCSSGIAYGSAISIGSSTTLKAIACDSIENTSAVASTIYTIQVNTGGGGGGSSASYSAPATPATPAVPGVSPAVPATPAMPSSNSAMQAQVTALLVQLQALIAQAKILGVSVPAAAESLSVGNTVGVGLSVGGDLTVGVRSESVRSLQDFLIGQNKGDDGQALKDWGSTGYFGELTRAALAEWQASVGISPASGYFGPITRGRLKSLGY